MHGLGVAPLRPPLSCPLPSYPSQPYPLASFRRRCSCLATPTPLVVWLKGARNLYSLWTPLSTATTFQRTLVTGLNVTKVVAVVGALGRAFIYNPFSNARIEHPPRVASSVVIALSFLPRLKLWTWNLGDCRELEGSSHISPSWLVFVDETG